MRNNRFSAVIGSLNEGPTNSNTGNHRLHSEFVNIMDDLGRFTEQSTAIVVALSADCELGEVLSPSIKLSLFSLLKDRLEDIASLELRLGRCFKEQSRPLSVPGYDRPCNVHYSRGGFRQAGDNSR
ncbi:hypothetical protein [Hahella chejuensis]|uniref:hypothetical protein n=1 Tax=Hahella chejuensis TaxID=158327 RepID=UPI0011D16E65|nr:hypothetical protein [Hahella chejuensis]